MAAVRVWDKMWKLNSWKWSLIGVMSVVHPMILVSMLMLRGWAWLGMMMLLLLQMKRRRNWKSFSDRNFDFENAWIFLSFSLSLPIYWSVRENTGLCVVLEEKYLRSWLTSHWFADFHRIKSWSICTRVESTTLSPLTFPRTGYWNS